jgi:hypothetical protein
VNYKNSKQLRPWQFEYNVCPKGEELFFGRSYRAQGWLALPSIVKSRFEGKYAQHCLQAKISGAQKTIDRNFSKVEICANDCGFLASLRCHVNCRRIVLIEQRFAQANGFHKHQQNPFMKKSLLLPCFLFAINASALPIFDPFADATANGGTDYAINSPLAGQTVAPGNIWNGIGGNFPGAEPTIVAGNLTFPGLAPSAGNSVSFTGASSMGARLDLTTAVGATGTFYYSFLLKITDVSQVPTDPTNNPFAAFCDDPRAQAAQVQRLGSRLVTKRVGDGYVLGISKSANTDDFVYDTTPHQLGEIVFVVGSHETVPGVETNVNLWVNPPLSSFGQDTAPTPTVSAVSGNSAINSSGVRAFAILCQFPTAPSGVIDDVRVGTNWSAISALMDPAIVTQPEDQNRSPGGTAQFTVEATGTAPLTYQWLKNESPLPNGGNVAGANTATLTLNNVSLADAGNYSVVVTNGVGFSLESDSAELTVGDPAISVGPQSRTNNYGTTATFTVVAAGTSPFSYQWQKEGVGNLSDGGNISGSQTATLTLTGVSSLDAGNYFVTVSNSHGDVPSESAALTVNDPAIVTQPMSITNVPGQTVVFHVEAVGSGSLAYQWQKDGDGNYIFDVGNLSGTSTDTLTITGIDPTNEGVYSVVIVGATIVTSENVNLKVLSPVSITTQPVSRTVAAGSTVAFGVGAGGTTPFTYQWLLNDTEIPGATNSAYVLTNVQQSAAGNYSVIVSNSVDSMTSEAAALGVSTNLQLYETNLVVVRVGDVSQALTPNGNSIFLDQFDTSGNYVNTVTIPDDGANGMVAIGWDNINGVNSGSTTGTSLTRSLDGRFMVVAGYNTNRNFGASLNTSLAADVPRGIGLINSHGQYTMPVASTDPVFDRTYWRAAVTDGTNNYWGVSGIAGTYYFGFDAPAVLVQNTFINSRSMGLFNGNIYCSTAASPTGVLKMDGMPTNAVTPTVLFNNDSGTYDLAVSPDGNVIYVADQRNVGANPPGGIQRFDFNGTSWSLSYVIKNGFGTLGPRYITADFSGANPVLYVTSNDNTFDNNRIIKVEDTGADSTGTTIAYAGINQTFRGIQFGPVASPAIITQPLLTVSHDGDNVVLSWTGAFNLESSTNVAGPYTVVSGAASPYTNSVNSAAQNFFRLHQ